MLAWLLLLFLTAFAALASFGVTVRSDVRSRLDAGILVTLVFFALVSAPVLTLGYAGQLRPSLVAPTSIALFCAVFFFSKGARSLAEHARESIRLARSLVSLPKEALDLALEERSFVVLGLAAAALSITFSAWLTYVAPSESWDGFFYHEPMIGFAIQNQGFRFVDLPPSGVIQATNGYPRLCEAFALFFVIFTDKTFIEIGNTIAAPGLLLVTFALCRRYNPSPVPALGWSAVIFLMPAVVTQMRTSMIDVEVAFFLIAAVYYATEPSFAFRDALVASLAMALLAGAKSSAIVWVPQLALVTYCRLWLRQEAGVLRSLALTVGGTLSLAGIGALTYLRNWQAFGNPIWPFRYTNPRLGLAWPGVATLNELSPQRTFYDIARIKYHHPTGGVGDIIARDYGYAIPWVILPLASLGLFLAAIFALRGRLAKNYDEQAENLVLLGALGTTFAISSPNLNIGRFNVQIAAIMTACVCFLAHRMHRSAAFHESAVAASLVLTLVAWVWTDWFFGANMPRMSALLRASTAERASMFSSPSFHLSPEIARAKEHELTPNSLVVFTQDLMFPGTLWNHTTSNRVEYLKFNEKTSFIEALEQRKPTWVVIGSANARNAEMDAPGSPWEWVGPAVKNDKTVVYRRR